MSDDSDLDLYQASGSPLEPDPSPPGSRPLSPWPLLIGVALLAIGATAFFLFRPHRVEPPSAPVASAPPATAPAPSASAAGREVVTTLPALGETDPAVREMIGEMSRHPLIAMRLDPLGDFRVDGLSQHPLRSLTKNARQHVLRRRGWNNESI